ncbi:unnamed protein product [Parnassius mnemosyne]|uniref:ER-bound oxygenase mpaB/mpaB'/Rubber oxygenase catalytic domain-containing protein n=1 Tax=Parnassius mnemosyne TaxID=213953 RepID=A0AAV1L7N9_9NEOP
MKLPEWFDEKLFNRGRKFYWQYCFGLAGVLSPGIIAVFAVPTILEVLVGSRRSSSKYTAFKRYMSTSLHHSSWFRYELKPGTLSWKSLYTVRSRHLTAGRAARLKKQGTISQRDLALTQFGFIGFVVLKPDNFGVRQLEDGDWDAYNYFWRVIGYMIGLEDRYNLCRRNMDETRKVCQIILDHVFTPCLENVPEYFEHMSRVMIDGMWAVNPAMETGSLLYSTKNLANVPGYVWTESERVALQARLRKQLNGKHDNIGVESTSLILKSSVEGLPERPPRLLFVKDYDTIESAPEYKKLSLASKYKLSLTSLMIAFYTTSIGRWLLNFYYIMILYMIQYFPYVAFFIYGIKDSYTNIFTEDPVDDTPPKPNSEYYKPQPPEPWYKALLSFW